MAILPSWTELPTKAADFCDELQNLFIRIMVQDPVSTPKVAQTVEAGMLGIKQRISMEKINLPLFTRHSGKNSLEGRLYREQLDQGWPGLTKEVEDICICSL